MCVCVCVCVCARARRTGSPVSQAGFHPLAEDVLELGFFLPLLPEGWDYRQAPPLPGPIGLFLGHCNPLQLLQSFPYFP